MSKIRLGTFALVLIGTVAAGGNASAQGGTAPQSQSMGASRSGSAIDSDSGKGGIPNQVTKDQFDKGFTGQESGIGERGSGQDQSTAERSKGKNGSGERGSQSSSQSRGQGSQAK